MNITYSEILYLFADKFVTQRAKFANLDNHPGGEKFPVKVLGETMVLAATIFLENKGYIKTSVKDVKKLLLFNGKDVFAERLNEPSIETTGIEQILLQNIQGEVKLQKAVYNLLTSNDVLPWGHIINISKQSLVKKGFISAEQEKRLLGHVTKYRLVPDKVREAEVLINEVETALNGFKSDAKYTSVAKALSRGIASRVEHESSDD